MKMLQKSAREALAANAAAMEAIVPAQTQTA
jgi:hypothetical protein